MRWTLNVLLIGALACSDSSAIGPSPGKPQSPPNGPQAPAPNVLGEYTLVLVNGAPLPSASPVGAGAWDYDGATYLLDGATLTLKTDGTFIEYWVHRRTLGSVPGELVSQSFTSQYTRLSDSTLRVGSGSGATLMTMTATGLVWQLTDFTLTYDRQR